MAVLSSALWTTNKTIGLDYQSASWTFFAVERDDEFDAALYVINHPFTDQYEIFDAKTANIREDDKSPILRIIKLLPDQGNVIFVRPRYTDQRYLNQKSILSCHANPFQPLILTGHEILIIRSEWKLEIRRRLRAMGISNSYVYPGLEGITREIKTGTFDPVVNGKLQMLHTVSHLKWSD